MAIITLTTDFGESDGYVGMMKGVIYAINPAALIVDLSHQVKAQNILQGAFLLHSSHRHFPPGTIHVGVVDPGVGTTRRAIALKVPEIGYFIGPDNGLFSYIIDAYPTLQARKLTNPAFQRQQISKTFHGRDIFSPVAAHLSNGEPFEEVGPLLDTSQLTMLENLWPDWKEKDKRLIKARVVHIDHFGNVVSNIPARLIEGLSQDELKRVKVSIPWKLETTGIKNTYGESKPNKVIALINSSDFLEIARVNGRADTLAEQIYVKLGDVFQIEL